MGIQVVSMTLYCFDEQGGLRCSGRRGGLQVVNFSKYWVRMGSVGVDEVGVAKSSALLVGRGW